MEAPHLCSVCSIVADYKDDREVPAVPSVTLTGRQEAQDSALARSQGAEVLSQRGGHRVTHPHLALPYL